MSHSLLCELNTSCMFNVRIMQKTKFKRLQLNHNVIPQNYAKFKDMVSSSKEYRARLYYKATVNATEDITILRV